MRHRTIQTTLIIIISLFTVDGWALDGERDWGISPYLGIFNPSLKSLNKGEFRSPYAGSATLVDKFGNTNNFSVPFNFRDPLPELDPGYIGGLEFQWRMSDKYSLLIGGATWEATSSATAVGIFPLQGSFESVVAQRKGDISFNEFYLGVRYNAIHKPKHYNLYYTLSLHEMFDVDYTENFSMLFLSGPPASFRRSLVIDTSATGLLLLQGGGGGEWFINDWSSLGIELDYGFGFKPLRLGNGSINTDFSGNDNLSLSLPLIQSTTSHDMEYNAETGGGYRVLRLDFDGWKALLKATIYF